jgi:hypothetical protein
MVPNDRSTPGDSLVPLTRLQRQEGYVIVLVFAVWFPVYLVWVRPLVERWASRYVDSIPAELHVIPALAVPLLAALLYRGFMKLREHGPN